MKLITLLTIAGTASAGFLTNSVSNVAVYWGQNSYGQGTGELAQQRLTTYCANANLDIIPMAFLYQITTGLGGQPVLNFANSQNNCTTFEGTGLVNCPDIGQDILACQQEYGKTILLSIGGATYTEGGFVSADAAVNAADQLWAVFGPLQPNSSALRPFGNAVIDGFDLDFETVMTNTVPFANQLRLLMDSDPSKQYFLTAAPQCPYPDYADNDMLSSGVRFDALFVQFYNNYCGVNAYTPTPSGGVSSSPQTSFNYLSWNTWARNVSVNPDVRIFLGVPANTGAAGTGFGGVMMWDLSQAYANPGFLDGVKASLQSSAMGPMRR
ncbi:hypothetical protein B0A50_08571 [Salinomyces thailandicus]|uniref:chitinase n=1 Tax=Salinomyces thailandicus TaxID=706561 RepID=A0A4U0TJB5_9PEZI|nr:hypothetical protein B0A50_08571 [Salinomyces thailandica]